MKRKLTLSEKAQKSLHCPEFECPECKKFSYVTKRFSFSETQKDVEIRDCHFCMFIKKVVIEEDTEDEESYLIKGKDNA